ncbi:MAG: radical SAM family heme chaperone HemW [Thermodesulfobacteriota bacterium]
MSHPLVPAPGLYLHVPFCLAKCPYCAFRSQPYQAAAGRRYLAAVAAEIALWRRHPLVRDCRFASLFVGGGTPTVLGLALPELLAACRQSFRLESGAEVTVEANPNTVDPGLLAALRRAGANRLSLGAQSLDNGELTQLGRSHDRTQVLAATAMAREAGFANLNLDLMYGLPGQSERSWQDSLEAAIALAPAHLAVYELTAEPGTPFAARVAAGQLRLPAEDRRLAMDGLAQDLLAAAGFERYEIANYARPGYACRHNLGYWANGPYLGLGPGAVSCLAGVRFENEGDLDRYCRRALAGSAPVARGEALTRGARFRETVILGLRRLGGVDGRELARRFGLSLETVYGPTLAALVEQGLLIREGEGLRLSAAGLPVANQVLAELV